MDHPIKIAIAPDNVTAMSRQQSVCLKGRPYKLTNMCVAFPVWRKLCLQHPDPCGVQKKEDPDTLCGFYRVKVEHTGRIYHVLALPRDGQGRRLKKNAFARRGGNRAAYYRVMRPASGFSSTDYDAESKFQVFCTEARIIITTSTTVHTVTHTLTQLQRSVLLAKTHSMVPAVSIKAAA